MTYKARPLPLKINCSRTFILQLLSLWVRLSHLVSDRRWSPRRQDWRAPAWAQHRVRRGTCPAQSRRCCGTSWRRGGRRCRTWTGSNCGPASSAASRLARRRPSPPCRSRSGAGRGPPATPCCLKICTERLREVSAVAPIGWKNPKSAQNGL